MRLEPEELAREIAAGEGKRLEFKRGLPADARVARTLCAFANTRGGLLLIGVGDRGEVVGAPRPRVTMERLRSVALELLEPSLEVEVGATVLAGQHVAWCSVPLSPRRPHAVLDDSGAREVVVRVGASNRRASEAALAALRVRPAEHELGELERTVLVWVSERARADGEATVVAFVQAQAVGRQRAQRAFARLELAGRLVAHGSGVRRSYRPA